MQTPVYSPLYRVHVTDRVRDFCDSVQDAASLLLGGKESRMVVLTLQPRSRTTSFSFRFHFGIYILTGGSGFNLYAIQLQSHVLLAHDHPPGSTMHRCLIAEWL